MPEPTVVRVGTPGSPAFQLRRGEEGLSVFDPDAVEPALTDDEILEAFRPGSTVSYRTLAEISGFGLEVVSVEGAETLTDRLRSAHREIRAGVAMHRSAFKTALKDLE